MIRLLENAISAISPQRALRRAVARYKTGLIEDALQRRGYDGARAGARWGGWIGSGSSANAEIGQFAARLRDRGRDLVRNDPHARRALKIIVSQVVGAGFVGHCATGDEKLDDRVDTLFAEWCAHADAEGCTNLDGLVALAFSAMVEGGDAFMRRRFRRRSDGLRIPMQVQVLEGDYLDTSRSGEGDDGLRYRDGIGFDGIDRRRAYLLHRSHPGDPFAANRYGTHKVDAGELIHVFHKERPGQIRGVSWFSAVISLLRDKGDFQEAALVKKRTESLFGVAIESAETGDGVPALSGSSNAATRKADEALIEELSPGMVMRLKMGEKATAFAPSSVAGDLDAFMLHTLMACGAGVGPGIMYHQISGDMRQSNYTQTRAGQLDQRRLIDQLQWFLVVPSIMERLKGWFVEAAIDVGELAERAGGYPFEWTPPAHEPLDPKGEQEADYFAVQTNRLTHKQYVERGGYSFRGQIKEQRRALDALENEKLPLAQLPGSTPVAPAKS